MDSDVLARIRRTVSRISVALESGSQISDSLRLSVFICKNPLQKIVLNLVEILSTVIVILSCLCFVLFLAPWNAELPPPPPPKKNRNCFM